MHNRALHDTLAGFVEEAAWQLAEGGPGGAKIPVGRTGPPSSRPVRTAPLYAYRPLTGRFIAERIGVLARLPAYPAAVQGLSAVPDLHAYLQARGRRSPGPDPRAQADAALQALLTAMWSEATDFAFDAERFAAAYRELEEAIYSGCALSTVITPVDGLVIESEEVALGDGLSLVRGARLDDAPGELRSDPYATVAVLRLEGSPGEGPGLETAGRRLRRPEPAGRRLRRLQTALRLWDDAEPSLGPVAWARTDDGPWLSVPLATGLRRAEEDCPLPAAEEDPLRAFCALVTRRTPRSGELAWALRRFELGCERGSALESLTHRLHARRALPR